MLKSQSVKYAIGLDLGGTCLKYGIVSGWGEIIHFNTIAVESEKGKDHIINRMIHSVEECRLFAEKNNISVTANGIGCPGSINSVQGISFGPTPHIPDWANVPVKDIIEKSSDIPVFVNNDAKLMTYGEYRIGAGQGYHSVAGITLGTGIGGGIIISGEILSGRTFNAAEFGHMTVETNGHPCACGNRGCLEQYAGGKFMIRNYLEATRQKGTLSEEYGHSVTVKNIFERWRNGDVVAAEIITKAAGYLGAGIANIAHIINPGIIIIGGGISEAGEDFIAMIRDAASGRIMKSALKEFKIVRARHGNRAGVIGAALWALYLTE